MPDKKKQTQGASSGTRTRKRVKVKTGQLVAVPLLDGTYALLHVAVYDGDIIGAHFLHRKSAPERLIEGLEEAMLRGPVAILAITSNRVSDGYWPLVGYEAPRYPVEMLDMKGSSYTAGITPDFFEACYGLRPWDDMGDPRCFEKMLLRGVPVPPTVRYKRDFEKDAAAAAASAPPAACSDAPEPPITDGPAEIHIEIKYPGEEFPSIDLLHRRQALERALEEAGAGEVTDAGGGGGIMDIYLATQDVRRAMPLVQAAVDASSFAQDATIETLSANRDDDDDDDDGDGNDNGNGDGNE